MTERSSKTDIQAIKIIMAMIFAMLILFLFPEVASVCRILSGRADESASLQKMNGNLEYSWNRRDRTPVLIVRSENGGTVELTCPNRAFSKFYVCPASSDNWTNKKVEVQWLEISKGVFGDVVHRAVNISEDTKPLFASSPTNIYRAELSASFFAMLVAIVITAPIWLLFYFLLKLLQKSQ